VVVVVVVVFVVVVVVLDVVVVVGVGALKEVYTGADAYGSPTAPKRSSMSNAVTVPLQFDEGFQVAVASVPSMVDVATTVPVLAPEGMATNSSLSPLKPIGTLADKVRPLVPGRTVTAGCGEPARGILSSKAFHCSSGG
jgi:hypothetical protein